MPRFTALKSKLTGLVQKIWFWSLWTVSTNFTAGDFLLCLDIGKVES